MHAIVGDQPLPLRVLGAFAARGDARALARPNADLDDSRAWVRQWALGALRGLARAQRLAAVEAAEPKLTHGDTREAVRREIQALSQAR